MPCHCDWFSLGFGYLGLDATVGVKLHSVSNKITAILQLFSDSSQSDVRVCMFYNRNCGIIIPVAFLESANVRIDVGCH